MVCDCLNIVGHAWTSDYGCADNEEEFKWLIK
jgi:prolyl oligopeptidase